MFSTIICSENRLAPFISSKEMLIPFYLLVIRRSNPYCSLAFSSDCRAFIGHVTSLMLPVRTCKQRAEADRQICLGHLAGSHGQHVFVERKCLWSAA